MEHPLQSTLDAQERNAAWLARKTGKSATYVYRVITGERRPSADFKAAAAAALGVPETMLFPAPEQAA